MIKHIINPDGSHFSRVGHSPSQKAYTEGQVKQALEAFVIDYFFDKKHGSMEMIDPENFGDRTVTEDQACDLIREFWEGYESSDYKLLGDNGFFMCGDAYVDDFSSIFKARSRWRVRGPLDSLWYFDTLQEAIDKAKQLRSIYSDRLK